MKRLILIFLFSLVGFIVNAQTCQTEQKEVQHSNGYEVFSICKTNLLKAFDEKKEYYWYTEYSNIKSTKGGCGGSLLNGNYKFYDNYGNLRVDKNYLLGLEDGNDIRWDSLGNITSKTIYRKGEMVYWKFLNEENYWVEFNGPIFAEGTVKKVYTKYGVLIWEEEMLPGLMKHVKSYYEYPSGQLEQEYTTFSLGGDYFSGKYTVFYQSGQIEIDGQYYEGELTKLRVGTWRWYNEDGTLSAEEIYKAEVTTWENGEKKLTGAYIYDSFDKKWVKSGEWNSYDRSGKLIESINYN